MEDFDFNELTSISRKITRGGAASILSPLTKVTNAKTGKVLFRLSQPTMAELGLETNSLSAKATKDGKKVYLAVLPGNQGDFFKSRGTGTKKGNTSEHKELSEFLAAAGMTGNNFSLTKVAEQNGVSYYQIAEIQQAASPEPAPKKKAAAKTAAPVAEPATV